MMNETGCFMKVRTSAFKLLTFVCLVVVSSYQIFAVTLKQDLNSTHLRWNIYTEKPNLIVEKRGDRVVLKTLNNDFYKQLEKDLRSVKAKNKYIRAIKSLPENNNTNVFSIEVKLASSDVEVFNFFREREKKHVLDFWNENSDESSLKEMSKKDLNKLINKTKIASTAKSGSKKTIRKVLKTKKSSKKVKEVISSNNEDLHYRDFRYGASFIWDYDSLGPQYKSFVDITRKTPEYFYPIKDIAYKNNEKNSHLQLAINYFRKKKFGLMYKTIKLYKSKYGDDDNDDLIEYLKVNAILRENMSSDSLKMRKMAVSMLDTIVSKTKNYDMKRAIYKYLLSYSLNSNEYVKGLNTAKRYYVATKENFDYEESQAAVEAILYNFSKLNQVEKLKELISDKTIVKIMPKQKLLAYEIYVHHKLGDNKEVLKVFKRERKNLVKPYLESIQFNVAEAYFRTANYDEAIAMFDEFVSRYSYHTRSSDARLRIALSYDILDRDLSKVALLYKSAINRSQSFPISYEARIRYVGLETIRKRKLDSTDLEKRIFLENNNKKEISNNLKKLLWQTRLRSYIVDQDYNKSLVYLGALPLTSLTPIERRVFEADGAETVYGIIFKHYEKSDFSSVVKTWNQYKKRYVKKIANDPFINFIVGRSYLNLGLYEGFNKLVTKFSKMESAPIHTFPHWTNRPHQADKALVNELFILKNIKLKNYDLALRQIDKMKKAKVKSENLNQYAGIVYFKKNNYKAASDHFEKFLTQQDRPKPYDPMDLAEMISMYGESVYNLNQLDKFQRVAKAMISDTKSYMNENPFVKSARERLEYLDIEIEAGKKNLSSALEGKLTNFKDRYPKSDYQGRMDYLLGRVMVRKNNNKEAKKLFQKILKSEEIGNSIKELARSELSLLSIKEQTL
jgi:outer membrane protein assembly factor BamD (BamD/ComL family)